MPASAKRRYHLFRVAASMGIAETDLALAREREQRFSGMVSMVSGAARASTYKVGEAFGSLVPVLAQSMRCFIAPAVSRSRQRLVLRSSQCAR